MAYQKTQWAAGNRLSIERMNKLEGGIASAGLLNDQNAALGADAQAMMSEVQSLIGEIETRTADGYALIDAAAAPEILSDKWGFFDSGNAASSSADYVTRTLSGFITRLIDPALYKNNGDNIEILQAGTYQVMKSVRLGAKTAEIGGQVVFAQGFKIIQTVGITSLQDSNVGGKIQIIATLFGPGITLTCTDGMIAIRKVG